MKLRTTLYCIVALSCAPSALSAELKIATWNLEHLAERNGEGCKPRADADYALLRGYATKLDADVVALQEIESGVAVARVFSLQEYVVVVPTQPMPRVGYRCSKGAGTRTPQRVGFAIRKGIAFTENAPLKSLDTTQHAGGDPLRWGIDITLQGKSPVRLLAVHLKSGCARLSENNENCDKLARQVPLLRSWIEEREREHTPYLILGDFNRWLGAADELVWKPLSSGLKLHLVIDETSPRPSPECNQRQFPDFVDHFVASDAAARSIVPNSFAELTYAEPRSRSPSDHCPLSIPLLVQ